MKDTLQKKCKLLNNFFYICKQNDHNIDKCLRRLVSRRCPSREIILVHVVQVETSVVQEQEQLWEYNTPNNQFGNRQYNSRANGQNWQGNRQKN